MSIGADGGVVLARLVRNGIVESVHTGHVVVCDAAGTVLAAAGDATRMTYVRSAIKPFQALATLDLLDAAGFVLDSAGLAIASASHDGTSDHQIEAARLLAEAGLDEGALQCPAALPSDPDTAWAQRRPHPLAHNCSGKHASFILATVFNGDDPAHYRSLDSPLQQRIRERLAESCDATPQGPGVDGCGAPAWLLPLAGLATGFARLAGDASRQLARVHAAMTAHPLLIGGSALADTQLMRADSRIVAKHGAEAVFGAGVAQGSGLGIAVKIDDGNKRADGPVVAAVLDALGMTVPAALVRPPVWGGGEVQGALEVDAAVPALAASARP